MDRNKKVKTLKNYARQNIGIGIGAGIAVTHFGETIFTFKENPVQTGVMLVAQVGLIWFALKRLNLTDNLIDSIDRND